MYISKMHKLCSDWIYLDSRFTTSTTQLSYRVWNFRYGFLPAAAKNPGLFWHPNRDSTTRQIVAGLEIKLTQWVFSVSGGRTWKKNELTPGPKSSSISHGGKINPEKWIFFCFENWLFGPFFMKLNFQLFI